MSAMDPQAQSPLFRLATEMRNQIYDYVLAPLTTCGPLATSSSHQVHTGGVDILRATSSEKSLVLTCRVVHAESTGIYKASGRANWTNTTFVINALNLDNMAKARGSLWAHRALRRGLCVQRVTHQAGSHQG